MVTTLPVVKLKAVVRFREFPFGTITDTSMREFMTDRPWENQEKVLQYMRSGPVNSLTMGADLTDWFDRPHKANPMIDSGRTGGTMEMTDGEWFWYAGLIHFIEKYNVRLPTEFVAHAARHGWHVNKDALPPAQYEFSYFDQ